MASSTADELKAQGNAAFKEGRFELAVDRFGAALQYDPNSHTLYSNRSGALAALARYGEALADAERAIALSPTWAKGYSRKGAALYMLGRYEEALTTYEAGLAVDPANQSIAQVRQGVLDISLARSQLVAPPGVEHTRPARETSAGRPWTPPAKAWARILATVRQCSRADAPAPRALWRQTAQDVTAKIAAARQLLEAAAIGDLATVRARLSSGVHPDGVLSSDGSSAMMIAAAQGHDQVVAELLGARADASKRNQGGLSAADLARASGHAGIVGALGGSGAGGSASDRNADGGGGSDAATAAAGGGARKGGASSFFANVKGLAGKAQAAAEKGLSQTMAKAQAARDDLVAQAARQKDQKEERERAAEAARQEAATARQMENDRKMAQELADASAREEGERVAAQTAAAAAAAVAAAAEQQSEAHRQRGNEAFKAQRYDDAVREYSHALEADPVSSVLYSNRSGALAATGAYEAALSDAEQCVRLQPDWAKGHVRKASALHGLQRYLQAIQSYDQALAHSPDDEALRLSRRQASFALAIEP